jgi:TRAP-type C4-dicarboxylate transport system substrate-binding protein
MDHDELAENLYNLYRNSNKLLDVEPPVWNDLPNEVKTVWRQAGNVYDVNIRMAHHQVKVMKDLFRANMMHLIPITQEELDKHINEVLEKSREYFGR